MKIKQINHIGIVVADLEKGNRVFADGLGLACLGEETVSEYHCKIAFYRCGEVLLELIEPTGPGPSREFLRSHGEGLHHICYEVDDIEAALAEARAAHSTDYDVPKLGAGDSRVFFLKADSIFNVETEFVELSR